MKRLDKDEYTVLNDLIFPKEDGKTAQIDHVVLSSYGIFVVEIKIIPLDNR